MIALFVALGGTGYAAATGSIDGREIKNSTIEGKDVKNSSLTGGDVKTSGLTGGDVKANSLTGSDLAESSLGKVPNASNADNAGRANSANTANSATTAGSATTANSATTAGSADQVNGSTLQKINFQFEGNSGPTAIFNRGGLVITATCTGGLSALTASTTEAGTDIRHYTVNETGVVQNAGEDEGFEPGETQNLRATNNNDSMGQLIYTRPNGVVATIDWVINGSSGGTTRPGTADSFDCQVTGNAIVG